jgi:hypothetical protein
MHLRIAIHLAGRGLENLGPAAAGHPQEVDRPHHRGLHRLDGVVLIVARGGRAGEVVDLVHLQPERMDDVVADELEVRLLEQVGDVRLLTGEEVVDADHVVPLGHEPLTEVAAEEAGPAGDENSFDGGHGTLRAVVRARRLPMSAAPLVV